MALVTGDRYVALGSSFAAGPGLMPRVPGSPRLAGRSTRNYAHLVAARLGLALTDVTFSGATTADLLTSSRADRPAQLDAVTACTRLVTITAGGNDIGYLPALTLASLPGPLPRLARVRDRIVTATDIDTVDARFATLAVALTAVVDRIHRQAPQAQVVFVDYLTILPHDSAIVTDPPGAQLAAWGRHTARRLAATTSAVAAATGSDFLDAGRRSHDHHAWATEPWTRRFHPSLRGGAPYHPNADGMTAVAAMIIPLLV